MNKPANFEIAKLLKEKGFMDKNMYGDVRLSQPKFYDNTGVIHDIKNAFENTELNLKECYNAPTIADVVMWLYEKHGIWISVTKYKNYGDDVTYFTPDNERHIYKTPTEAYEARIKHTLENLI